MELITVVRGNEELDVSADQKERYKQLGYHVIDKQTGKVLEKAPLTDVAALQNLVVKLESENKALKDEIEKLKKPAKKQTASTKE
jgi:hypothetical protein